MNLKQFIFGVILILSLTILLDQLTKYIAFIVLFKEKQVLIINHYLNFRPVWNDGISFGMLQGYGNLGRISFIIIAISISSWIIIYSRKLNIIGFVGYNMIHKLIIKAIIMNVTLPILPYPCNIPKEIPSFQTGLKFK